MLKDMYDKLDKVTNLLDENDGLITDEIQQLLSEIELDERGLITYYSRKLELIRNDIESNGTRIKNLKTRNIGLEKQEEFFVNNLVGIFKNSNIIKYKLDEYDVVMNTSKKAVITDKSLILDKYIKEKIDISYDVASMKELLLKDETVPGAKLVTNNNILLKL